MISGTPWSVGLVALALVVVWSLDVRRPWVGAHDWNGAAWSTAAWNIRRAGWLATAGAASLYHGPLPLPANSFYIHHPPMIVWLTAAAYAVFGEREWACRLVPIAFTLATLCVLSGLLRQAVGRFASWWASACFALLPAVLYYGKMPNHEPLALFGMTAAAWCFWRWRTGSGRSWVIGGGAALAFGCLSGWGAYLFAAVLFTILWFDAKPAGGALAAILLATILPCLAIAGQIAAARPEDGFTSLLAAFLSRSGSNGVTITDWAVRVAGHAFRLLSPVAVSTLVVFGVLRIRADIEMPDGIARCVVLPLVVAGIGNVLVFREGSFTHEYYCYYLTVPVALCFGLFVGWLHAVGRPSQAVQTKSSPPSSPLHVGRPSQADQTTSSPPSSLPPPLDGGLPAQAVQVHPFSDVIAVGPPSQAVQTTSTPPSSPLAVGRPSQAVQATVPQPTTSYARRARAVALCLTIALVLHSLKVWVELRRQQSMFFAGPPEPPHFAAELGRLIQQHFPPEMAVMTDAIDHGPQLGWYARRKILYPASGAFSAEKADPFTADVGGLIYLGYPVERQYWQSLLRRNAAGTPPRWQLSTVRLADHDFGIVRPTAPAPDQVPVVEPP